MLVCTQTCHTKNTALRIKRIDLCKLHLTRKEETWLDRVCVLVNPTVRSGFRSLRTKWEIGSVSRRFSRKPQRAKKHISGCSQSLGGPTQEYCLPCEPSGCSAVCLR
ncbi:hypothetical protein I79_013655 [Cricetulus griseus]|uniref:Uncharacterized protein n=1 Tax=Cricetulus griseus TaxID=10029 RepID=G3HS29_CRIGR|nr:hypothetical protein I79_013655 [Cricetulus griseus]